MFPDNLTRAEAQARAALIGTDTYAVHVDLSGREVEDPTTLFTSSSRIRFTAREAGSLHVDLIAERVRSAELDGVALDPATFVDSRLPFDVTPGEHELHVDAVVRYSRSGDGLHRFVDPADGLTYLYTQFEPADARRVYACFEQPDLKARFSISVVAPADWTVVSGGAVESQEPVPGDGGDDLVLTTFATTEPVSTYLTSLLAGHYAIVDGEIETAPAARSPSRVICRRSLAESLDTDAILEVTQGGFAHVRAPLRAAVRLRQVRPGLRPGVQRRAPWRTSGWSPCATSTSSAAASPRPPATTGSEVILHELAHMWFGDLVTMRWWDDLWLKESFATWSSNFAVGELTDDPATQLGLVQRRVQDRRAARRPAALHAPGRRRHRRPRGRQHELRPDHLRQGRLGAGAAGGLRRAGRRSSRASGPTSPSTRSATPASPTCWPRSSRRRGAT